MQKETIAISKQELLEKANKIIQEHDDFLEGMQADDVEQKSGVLVFKGEYFLDDQGLPTLKRATVFNMFKHLAHVLSEQYHLAD